MMISPYEPVLLGVLMELEPYLEDLVLIGGWVPYLYQRYGGFSSWAAGLSLTIEVDLLVDLELSPGDRPPIADILRTANFRPSAGQGGSAVWERGVGEGERIEFLLAHQGIARREGVAIPLGRQPGMAAIPLEGLGLMRRFRSRLTIPAGGEESDHSIGIWVPTLGAYVLNKSSTFIRRSEVAGGGNPKRAKDLLYIRDVMAAGGGVVSRVESDLAECTGAGELQESARNAVRYARDNLTLAMGGAAERFLGEAALMLAEREPAFTEDAALADMRGHIADLVEILEARRE